MFRLTFLALAALFLVVEASPHRNATGTIQVKYYSILNEDRSFVGAILACEKAGMQIASVNSEEEQLLLQSAIDSASVKSPFGYWIGAAAVDDSDTDVFYWINSGLKMLTYKNWGTSQPNFINYSHDGICVRVGNYFKVDEPYQWENFDCTAELFYICEAQS
ncbi:hypothetical protein ABEB36_004524 [Hypothenemus hampei]|uniref:C-type lectin domain-containing protein n=1 Tax=Hypothenemus hampei TaxID=57062 RepID=A0ABD1F3K1_HYPHA